MTRDRGHCWAPVPATVANGDDTSKAKLSTWAASPALGNGAPSWPTSSISIRAIFAITNPRLSLGVGLRWPLEVFDKAWLWQEVHSTMGWPWFGRAYVDGGRTGVSPSLATDWPESGPAGGAASCSGRSGFTPGDGGSGVVRGDGPVAGIAEGGAVTFAGA